MWNPFKKDEPEKPLDTPANNMSPMKVVALSVIAGLAVNFISKKVLN